jgi:hypothetical protein
MTAPDLSICIVNWNTREDLEQALASILHPDPGTGIQVVVVDNASDDGSADMVCGRFPTVTLVESRENLGFARGYNRAASESRGRHLLILNPDTLVHRGALAKLTAYLDAHPEAGAIGPRLLNTDGSLQFSCRRFPTPLAALFRNTILGRLVGPDRFTRDYLMSDWDHSSPRAVDWISGAAMGIRREVWEKVGGFDEGFFMYAEDMDWCLRARQAGYEVHYVPDAVITHRIGRSSDQRPVAMLIQFHRSMARFYRKHYAQRWPRGLRWLPVAGIWLRAALILAQVLWAEGRDRIRAWRAPAS